MVEYGCNVANKFGFMSDDDEFEDPRELIEKAAKADAIKAAVKKAPVPAPVPAKKEPEAPKPVALGKENRPVNGERSERGARGRGGRGRGGPREGGNRPPRAEGGDLADRFGENRRGGPRRGNGRPFRGRGGTVNVGEEPPKSENTFEEVGAQAEGGEARPRRGRGGFRGGRGRGRQFDRQSGSDRTGVRPVEKKAGFGKGNWGDDEIAGETEPIAAETEPQEPAAPREKTADEIKYENELEEYNKMKTLKEFKAQQKTESNEFKTRKAGEGVNENYGKLIPLQKTDSNKDEEVIVMRKESNKKVLNIDIHFLEANRGRFEAGARGGGNRGNRGDRGDRGDRGNRGPRGTGHRGGAGGQRPHGGSHFDASSAEDFPALK